MRKKRALKVTMIPDEDVVTPVDDISFEDKMVLVGATIGNTARHVGQIVAVYILCDTCRKILVRRLG